VTIQTFQKQLYKTTIFCYPLFVAVRSSSPRNGNKRQPYGNGTTNGLLVGLMDKGQKMADLTDRVIQAAKAKPGKDDWLSDGGARGAGRLYVRIQSTGRKIFYFRYAGPDGERQSLPLGEYSQKGARAGLSLDDARRKAGDLSRMYQDGIKDLRGHLEGEQIARERELRQANEDEVRIAAEAKQGSLRNLLNGYTDHLTKAKKTDAKDVKGIFKLHVFEAFPDLADRKASEVKGGDLRKVLARLVDAEKGRTAGKLRSYMRAAYAAALKAEFDPTAPETLMGYGIESNPCDALPSLAQFNNPGNRTLTANEMRLYLVAVDALPMMTRSALLLSLYLGGQRPTQLLRVTSADIDLAEVGGQIRLYDSKGARQTPRLHALPLCDTSKKIVVSLLEVNANSKFLISNSENTHVTVETMSTAVNEISAALVKAKKVKSTFKMSDIRRTCETMLAAMGISKDVRAQILSHGLGGVQDRNYDRHTYTDEKTAALTAWDTKLEAIRKGKAPDSNVVSLETARVA
jgi:integrase